MLTMGDHSGKPRSNTGEVGKDARQGESQYPEQKQRTYRGYESRSAGERTDSSPGQRGSRETTEPTSVGSRRSVRFEVGGELLRGTLRMPPDPIGIVVLVSGSCGVAQAPRETELVKQLIENSVATFAVDLLTPTEASDRGNQRNLDLLSERVAIVTDWISERDGIESLDVGYYGTGTGGSAVLQFVKYGSVPVRAVALYNGRPDLSTTVPSVPVFCAVDEGNEHLLETNEQFYERVKQSQARSEFLRAEEGTQVIPQMAHWFGASFRRAGSSPYRT